MNDKTATNQAPVSRPPSRKQQEADAAAQAQEAAAQAAQAADNEAAAAAGEADNAPVSTPAAPALPSIPQRNARVMGSGLSRPVGISQPGRQNPSVVAQARPVNTSLITPDAAATTTKAVIGSLVEKIENVVKASGLPEVYHAKFAPLFRGEDPPMAIFSPQVYFADLTKVALEMNSLMHPIQGYFQPRDQELPALNLEEDPDHQWLFLGAVKRYGRLDENDPEQGEFWSYNLIIPQTFIWTPRVVDGQYVYDGDEMVFDRDIANAPAMCLGLDLLKDRNKVMRFRWSPRLYLIPQTNGVGARTGRFEDLLSTLGGPGWKNLEGRLLHLARFAGFPLHEQRVNAPTEEEERMRRRESRQAQQPQPMARPTAGRGAGRPADDTTDLFHGG